MQKRLKLLPVLGPQRLEIVQTNQPFFCEAAGKPVFPQGEEGGVPPFQQIFHGGGFPPAGACGEEDDFVVQYPLLKGVPQAVGNCGLYFRHMLHPR